MPHPCTSPRISGAARENGTIRVSSVRPSGERGASSAAWQLPFLQESTCLECVGHDFAPRCNAARLEMDGLRQEADPEFDNPLADRAFETEGQATGLPRMPSMDGDRESFEAEAQGLGRRMISRPVMPESLEEQEWLKQRAKVGEWLAQVGRSYENERDRRLRINLEYLDKSNLLSPDSKFRRKWDVTQLICVIYVALVVPYRLGFSVDVEFLSFPFFWIDLIVDIYFIVDIVIALRTAYYNKVGELVVSKEQIKNNYMWTPPYWFFIDIAACFPGTYIEWYMQHSMAHDMSNSEGSTNRMLRLMRLLRLLKLLRLLRLNRLMAKYEEELQHFMTTLQVWKILIGMVSARNPRSTCVHSSRHCCASRSRFSLLWMMPTRRWWATGLRAFGTGPAAWAAISAPSQRAASHARTPPPRSVRAGLTGASAWGLRHETSTQPVASPRKLRGTSQACTGA
eukprot:COSAG05_NODE_2242_length_3351_cov_2.034133_1_plen_455_part_00